MQRSALVYETAMQPPETLDALVSRAKGGDAAAFTLLYRLHVNRIYAFTVRRLVDQDAAEEATQEVFVRALTKLSRCGSGDVFPGWLFGIAHRVVLEQRRGARLAASALDDAQGKIDPSPGPEDQALRASDVDSLRQGRERCLTDKEQALFDMLLADLTDAQIAAALDCRRGAIRTARWRLFAKLRSCLAMLANLSGVSHGHA